MHELQVLSHAASSLNTLLPISNSGSLRSSTRTSGDCNNKERVSRSLELQPEEEAQIKSTKKAKTSKEGRNDCQGDHETPKKETKVTKKR